MLSTASSNQLSVPPTTFNTGKLFHRLNYLPKLTCSHLTRDSFTPDQSLIISPHPHCRNLYFALGGSFHSWKFLPIIGSYVVQMLHGELEPEKAKKWAWDRASAGGAHGTLAPKRDLTDILGYSEMIQSDMS